MTLRRYWQTIFFWRDSIMQKKRKKVKKWRAGGKCVADEHRQKFSMDNYKKEALWAASSRNKEREKNETLVLDASELETILWKWQNGSIGYDSNGRCQNMRKGRNLAHKTCLWSIRSDSWISLKCYSHKMQTKKNNKCKQNMGQQFCLSHLSWLLLFPLKLIMFTLHVSWRKILLL